MNKNIGSRYYYEKDLVRNVQDVGRGRPSLKRASMFCSSFDDQPLQDNQNLTDRPNVRHFEVGFGTRAGVG